MDKCPICGRSNPLQEANFCYYCGASFREDGKGPVASGREMPRTDEEKELVNGRPFGTVRWLLCFALLLIPVYGWLAFVVIMAIGTFSPNATKERKDIQRALFIFSLAAIVLMIIMVIIALRDPEYQAYVKEIMNSYNSTGTELIFGLR